MLIDDSMMSGGSKEGGGVPPGVKGTHFRGQKTIFLKKSIFLLRMSKKSVFRVKGRFFEKNRLLRNPPGGGAR